MKTLLFCGALSAVAAPAAAQVRPVNGNPEFRQVSVSFADLDLDRPAGADAMIARVRRAAGLVCRDQFFSGHTPARRYRVCVRTAMNGAFEQLEAPLVTARFRNPTRHAELATQ